MTAEIVSVIISLIAFAWSIRTLRRNDDLTLSTIIILALWCALPFFNLIALCTAAAPDLQRLLDKIPEGPIVVKKK